MLDFSLNKHIKDAKWWKGEINQLYHPTGIFKQDSQMIVYARDSINATKYIEILLKEWFYLVKKDGYLVIDYRPNKMCDWHKLETTMWWLWKNKYEIIYHGPFIVSKARNNSKNGLKNEINSYENYYKHEIDKETLLPLPTTTQTTPLTVNGYMRFVAKKNVSTQIPGDIIEKWSFGIITNGVRGDWIENIIQSIRKQNIPDYEIIICGTYYDRKENDCRYIPFNQRDDKRWITKKKNIIAREANYQNLCIVHDRIYFDDKWYKGIKKWGDCFEMLAVPQLYEKTNDRFGDWVCNKDFDIKTANNLVPVKTGYLKYTDWDKNVPGFAAVIIIKKDIFLSNSFNETLYWGNQFDDILTHQELCAGGYILRMNPLAITYSKTMSVYDPRWYYEENHQILGSLKGVNPLLLIGLFIMHIFGVKKNSQILEPIKVWIKKRSNILTHQNK